MYDIEPWQYTPPIEQQHPKAYIDAFCQVAVSRNQRTILTPARGLTGVSSADCVQFPGEDVTAAYLRCQLPAACAGADVLDVQAQPLQSNVPAYTALVQGARTQRPNQSLWAGLTTMRGDPVSAMVACYESVLSIVQGFWLNTTPDTINVAAAFLQAIK